jgi:hypothetical protein
MPFWVTEEAGNSLWDELFLGGVTWPGVWQLKTSVGRAVDKAKTAGVDGYTTTDKGYTGGEISLEGKFFRELDWLDFEALLPNFHPRRPGAIKTPLDIYHPAPALLGITYVYLENIEIGHPTAPSLICPVTLKCSEWFPNTKKTSSSKKVKGFSGTGNAGQPLNPQDFQVNPPSSGGSNL